MFQSSAQQLPATAGGDPLHSRDRHVDRFKPFPNTACSKPPLASTTPGNWNSFKAFRGPPVTRGVRQRHGHGRRIATGIGWPLCRRPRRWNNLGGFTAFRGPRVGRGVGHWRYGSFTAFRGPRVARGVGHWGRCCSFTALFSRPASAGTAHHRKGELFVLVPIRRQRRWVQEHVPGFWIPGRAADSDVVSVIINDDDDDDNNDDEDESEEGPLPPPLGNNLQHQLRIRRKWT